MCTLHNIYVIYIRLKVMQLYSYNRGKKHCSLFVCASLAGLDLNASEEPLLVLYLFNCSDLELASILKPRSN